MKKEIIKNLTNDFESYANQTQNEIEFWFARDLQHLLGYTEWRNFTKVINKAKTACGFAGRNSSEQKRLLLFEDLRFGQSDNKQNG